MWVSRKVLKRMHSYAQANAQIDAQQPGMVPPSSITVDKWYFSIPP